MNGQVALSLGLFSGPAVAAVSEADRGPDSVCALAKKRIEDARRRGPSRMPGWLKKHRFPLFLSLLLLAAKPVVLAGGEIVIDGFEDGSDAGWQVVGHGPLMRSYHKALVSPGSAGSAFALRLTRDKKDGWCGLGIGHLSHLRLTSASAVRLMARNAGGVQKILVDVHCSDGSRWWCKRPLRKDEKWTEVYVAREDFFAIDNPHSLKHPDLTTIERLWLTMDELTPKRRGGRWAMGIDSVRVIGAGQAREESSRVEAPSSIRWNGPSIVVGVIDTDALPRCGQNPGLPRAFAEALNRAGCAAKLIAPGSLKSVMESARLDALMLNGPAYVVNDAGALIEHLKRGKALWLISAAPVFSRPIEPDGAGGWYDAPHVRPDPVLNRILNAPQDVAPGWVQRPKHPLELTEPRFELTGAAQSWWPFLPAALPATKCSVLSANDSIFRPSPPPWVTCTPLLVAHYRKKNWIQQEDRFTGRPMVLLSHRAGPFAGARVLFSGVPNDPRSILHPSHPAFAAVAVSCLRHLVASRPERMPTSPPPFDGRPPLARDDYFTYPGPVFMPIHFGGVVPTDVTFWQDMKLGGFNAIHAGIAWKIEADDSGNVIDWRPMDRVLAEAGKRGYRVVFDPYVFNWDRFRAWTGDRSIHNTLFRDRFAKAMGELARRYSDEQTLVALYATPHTHTYNLHVDGSTAGRAAWRRFVRKTLGFPLERASRRYGVPLDSWENLPLPKPTTDKPFNIGPLWSDYLRFHHGAYHAFMRHVIETIRSAAPAMPILLRGPYLEVAINMKIAAEFANVAAHCECIETSADIEGYHRSLGLRFGVPISAENGWPKSRAGPLRAALADYLMGGYRDFQYAFSGPAWARPSIEDLHDAQKAAHVLRPAKYPRANLALLIPDTTLWASRPPNFFSMQKRPHLEFAMERSGLRFEAVSAHYPRLDGLDIIVDDGGNDVLTASCRDALAAWVRAGGTLVVFAHTGAYILDDSKPTLAGALNVKFTPRPGATHEIVRAGKGRVVVLHAVPKEEDVVSVDRFERLLRELGAVRDVRIRPRVNNACFIDKEKTYLVIFNKSRKHVGAFFRESTLAEAETALPDLVLTIKPGFQFKSAKDVISDEMLGSHDGEIGIRLPATRWKVIEFDK